MDLFIRGLILGLFIGGNVGFFVAAMCASASRRDSVLVNKNPAKTESS